MSADLAALLVAAVTVLGAALTARVSRRGDTERRVDDATMRLLDALQERVAGLEVKVAGLEAEVAAGRAVRRRLEQLVVDALALLAEVMPMLPPLERTRFAARLAALRRDLDAMPPT